MKQQHGAPVSAFRHRHVCRAALGLAIILLAAPAMAQEAHRHDGSPAQSQPPVFVASTAKSFAALMDDAMAIDRLAAILTAGGGVAARPRERGRDGHLVEPNQRQEDSLHVGLSLGRA